MKSTNRFKLSLAILERKYANEERLEDYGQFKPSKSMFSRLNLRGPFVKQEEGEDHISYERKGSEVRSPHNTTRKEIRNPHQSIPMLSHSHSFNLNRSFSDP
ncbi:hypothetical protein RJT34_32475 [Clitoria ternatea]|uniref:Uncharacterized protein n=1 Tax=Clitoria ternatea TaxID=43366 RepID=A0AAN9I3T5_CLITE